MLQFPKPKNIESLTSILLVLIKKKECRSPMKTELKDLQQCKRYGLIKIDTEIRNYPLYFGLDFQCT